MSDNITPPPPHTNAPPPPPASDPTPPPPPHGGGPTGNGPASENRTIMIVLAYLGILALIPLLVEKDDREVQWHAKHGLVLTAFWFILFIIFTALSFVPVLGCITSVVSLLLFIPIVIIHILCIVKGVNGERFLIPGISHYADSF